MDNIKVDISKLKEIASKINIAIEKTKLNPKAGWIEIKSISSDKLSLEVSNFDYYLKVLIPISCENYSEDNFLGISVNITKTEEVENLFNETINKFGKIDILVNNAGIAPAKPLEMMSDEDFINVIDINLIGAFRCTREAIKYMKNNGGSIINTSSFVSLYGGNSQSAYSASKSGLNGLTKSNAKELGKYNIRVNAVAPGVIMTDMVKTDVDQNTIERLKMMTPLQRTADPKDLVGIYVYLASDESLHTTGTIINIDGGLVM